MGKEQLEEKQSMKDSIIYESLKLFSMNGFDAVSTRMIARAVNASDAVIYKHFASKQEILDKAIEKCKAIFFQRRNEVQLETLDWMNLESILMNLFIFQITNEWVVMFRRLLVVEQYKNPKMKEMYQEIFIDSAIRNMSEMFQILIEQGYVKPGNSEVYALELYAPFFMYQTVGGDSEQILKNLKEHIVCFRYNNMSELSRQYIAEHTKADEEKD